MHTKIHHHGQHSHDMTVSSLGAYVSAFLPNSGSAIVMMYGTKRDSSGKSTCTSMTQFAAVAVGGPIPAGSHYKQFRIL